MSKPRVLHSQCVNAKLKADFFLYSLPTSADAGCDEYSTFLDMLKVLSRNTKNVPAELHCSDSDSKVSSCLSSLQDIVLSIKAN